MLTVILTCLLTAGTALTPTPPWVITRVEAGGWNPAISVRPYNRYCYGYGTEVACEPPCQEVWIGPMRYCTSMGSAPGETIVEMRRTLQPGETVPPREGCTLRMEHE